MNYPEECKYCKKYTLPDKYCCKRAFEDRTDDSVLIIPEEIHYNTEETIKEIKGIQVLYTHIQMPLQMNRWHGHVNQTMYLF